jgi:ornithine cyclodeaminase/alanine dehydrogenase-like protein (mu-crystallin family)
MPIHRRGEVLIKHVGYCPHNPRDGLPTVISTFSLLDTGSGRLLAVTDGVVATALRTGAASAVASRVLARPDARTAGLVGCGAQAVAQLHALSRVFRLERALVHDIDADVARSFPRRTSFVGLDVEVAPLERVEREADILCTVTSVAAGHGPVIRAAELCAAVHVNAVGSDFTGKTELPRSLLERSLVCPDFLPQALREGECQQIPAEQIGPSLPEVVRRADELAAWRDRSTVFDSTGFALEDHVAMHVLLRHARRLGRWSSVPIEYLPQDPRDPYSRPIERSRAAEGAPARARASAPRSRRAVRTVRSSPP